MEDVLHYLHLNRGYVAKVSSSNAHRVDLLNDRNERMVQSVLL